MINIDDFIKIEMRVGTVLQVEEVAGSDKLWKLTVSLGEENPRTVLSGIKKWYSEEELKDNQFVFVSNLEPRPMMGMESQAMIMASEGDDKPVLLVPQEKVLDGAKIR